MNRQTSTGKGPEKYDNELFINAEEKIMIDQRNHKDQLADVSLPKYPLKSLKRSALKYGDEQAILLILQFEKARRRDRACRYPFEAFAFSANDLEFAHAFE